MPGGMLALSANGSAAGTGILWAVVPLDGDANRQRGVKGIVLALDAQDVSRTLWTSEQFSDRDRLGLFAKFNPPIVANGKVFVPTYGDQEPRREYGGDARPPAFPGNYHVAVYGLLEPPPARVIVNQDRDDVTVVRAQTQPLTLGPNQCTPIDGASVDCTEALTQTAGAPSLHRVVFGASQSFAGLPAAASHGGQQGHGAGEQRRDRLLERAGHRRQSGGGELWPLRAQGALEGAWALRRSRTAPPATLHEFVGVANCPAGERCRAEPTVQAVHAVRGSGRWQNLPQLGSRPELPDQPDDHVDSTGAATCCSSNA